MEDEFGIGVGVGSVTETVTRGLQQQPFRSSQFFCREGERGSLGGWTVECRIANRFPFISSPAEYYFVSARILLLLLVVVFNFFFTQLRYSSPLQSPVQFRPFVALYPSLLSSFNNLWVFIECTTMIEIVYFLELVENTSCV